DGFEEAHDALDKAGREVRNLFGCRLGQEGTEYFQDCPVALAHNRLGMSVGVVVEAAECSICGRSPDECEHVTGRMYGNERCVRVITRADLTEVSLVRRPAFPDARIDRVSVPLEKLQVELGPIWKAGMSVLCNRCLLDCDGVIEHMNLGSH
ncbi:MAG: HK97 family phage prohead protease, partial [Ilumatobacteraceae bacterium]